MLKTCFLSLLQLTASRDERGATVPGLDLNLDSFLSKAISLSVSISHQEYTIDRYTKVTSKLHIRQQQSHHTLSDAGED